MNILFTDLDGVLNSDNYFRSESYKNETGNLSDEVIMFSKQELLTDPLAISILNKFVEESQVKVVLSSTWRLKFSIEEMNNFFYSRGATFKISDKTPRGSPRKFSIRVYRYDEIQEYLNSLEIHPDKFVIFEDVEPMGYLDKYVVRTNFKEGLTEFHTKKALEILKG